MKIDWTILKLHLQVSPGKLASPSLLELTWWSVSVEEGPGPKSKGGSFFSLLVSFLELGFAAQDRSGGSKILLVTSGGAAAASSPGSTRRPFSRREDGSLKQVLHRESASCLSSLAAPRSSADIKLMPFIRSWRSCFIFSSSSTEASFLSSFLSRASSRRPRRAASRTSESSLEARCINIRANPSSFAILQSELFSCNR